MNRTYEQIGKDVVKRENPIPSQTRRPINIQCGRRMYEVFVSPGQIINPKKMCHKLLLSDQPYEKATIPDQIEVPVVTEGK